MEEVDTETLFPFSCLHLSFLSIAALRLKSSQGFGERCKFHSGIRYCTCPCRGGPHVVGASDEPGQCSSRPMSVVCHPRNPLLRCTTSSGIPNQGEFPQGENFEVSGRNRGHRLEVTLWQRRVTRYFILILSWSSLLAKIVGQSSRSQDETTTKIALSVAVLMVNLYAGGGLSWVTLNYNGNVLWLNWSMRARVRASQKIIKATQYKVVSVKRRWYPTVGKPTVGLASHWRCATEKVCPHTCSMA